MSMWIKASIYQRYNAHALGRTVKPGVPARNKVTNDKNYLLGLYNSWTTKCSGL